MYIENSFTYAENDDGSGVRYLTGIKSAGFRSWPEASHMSSHTEESWYNETSPSAFLFLIFIRTESRSSSSIPNNSV